MSCKKKVKSLLICNSNMFIPTVLSEVLSNPLEDYLVASDTKSISRFFEFMDIKNVDFLEYGRLEKHFDFIREKRRISTRLMTYEIGDVVFFHAESGEMANWIIKKLSKSHPIKYCKIYDSIPLPNCREIKNVIIIKLRQYYRWGVSVNVLQNVNPFPSLPQKFYKDVKAETIAMPIYNQIVLKAVSNRMKDVKLSGRYMLLTGTVVHGGFCNEEEYTSFINQVIGTLGKENVISKCHPRFKDLYGLEKQLPQIPSFIPGNVLIENYDYYIGFESTLLVESAVAGKTAISLIDWLCKDKEQRKNVHNFFDSRLQGKGVIHFPKTQEELKFILSK